MDEPGARASCEISDVSSDSSAGGGRVGEAVPLSPCQFPVRKVPGCREFELPPELWKAP